MARDDMYLCQEGHEVLKRVAAETSKEDNGHQDGRALAQETSQKKQSAALKQPNVPLLKKAQIVADRLKGYAFASPTLITSDNLLADASKGYKTR